MQISILESCELFFIDQKNRVYGPWTDVYTCVGIGEDTSCGEGQNTQTRTCSPGTGSGQSCPNGEIEERQATCQLPECPSKS